MNADAAYSTWLADPTPGNLNAVVRSLDKTVGYAISSLGVADNPQMRHQARLFVADAVKKFDPASGVKLGTWAQSNLQSLRRFRREHAGPVKVPERAQLDAWHLETVRRKYLDEHGVDPDVKQLADASHLSVKRIADVRKATRPVVASGQIEEASLGMSDYMGEALEYLYDESDATDRAIIEHTTGYGGKPVLQKNETAALLGISPSQVTRRSERIGQRLLDLERDITTVSGS